MVSVHPAQRRTSPLGVVPVGSGDGVGDCHDVANLPCVRLFIFLLYLFWWTNLTFFSPYGFVFYCTEYASSQAGAHSMPP